MINNWKTLDSSCVNTVCCEHVFTTWYRAFLNNNALMVMSMGSYPKDITRNFLVVSMSTAICFPIRSIAEQQTYCTPGAIQFAIAILSDRLSLARNVTQEQEDLLGIRPNYFETLGLPSFPIRGSLARAGLLSQVPKLLQSFFAQRFCWNRRKQRDVKFTSGSPLMILKRKPGKVFWNPAHENTAPS